MIRRMTRPKIKDCLPILNGVWSHIDYQFPEIFDIDASQLDIIFMSNWSMRTAAPILHLLHDDEDTTMLTQEELVTLGAIINGLYKHKWDKLMEVAAMEYDPIHNFSDHLVEGIEYAEGSTGSKTGSSSSSSTRTDNLTRTETDTKGYTDTFNNTDARSKALTEQTTFNTTLTDEQITAGYTEQKVDGYTEQVTDGYTDQVTDGYTQQDPNNKRTTEELIAGFNSSGYEEGNKTITDEGKVKTSQGKIGSSQGKIGNSQGKIENSDGKTQEKKTGTETVTDNGTDNVVHTGTVSRLNSGTLTEQNTGTQTNSGSGTSSESSTNGTEGERTREYTKTGNIGNLSTQKLLKEEIDLWQYNFILEMMRDVIGTISLPIYDQ